MSSSSASELRAGVRESFRVRRAVRLESGALLHLQQAVVLEQLNHQCEQLLGFNRLLLVKNSLELEYDAGYLQLDTLLQQLVSFDVTLASDRWSRIRLGWYRYQDANIRDNARNTDSTCCSQSPLRNR